MRQGLTGHIASFVSCVDGATIPSAALRRAERVFVDTVGVAIGGYRG